MLTATLGIDTSSPGGLMNLAIIAAIACIIIGFFADCLLTNSGFGVFGNGVIVVSGMYLTTWLIDHRIARYYEVNATGSMIFVAAIGALFLVVLSAIKRRFY